MIKQGKLNELVREEAAKNCGRYNFCKNKEQMILHNRICKSLVKIADNKNIPITLLVYVAVGTNAHRPIVFERGYKHFDEKKANTAIKFCEIFAKKFGEKWLYNPHLFHTVCRYLEIKKIRKEITFRNIVNNCDADFDGIKIDSAKKFAKYLFGNDAQYSNADYIVEVKTY